jgi:hypothetical protein
MQEPVSTLTNLAFIAVGLIIFRRSWYAGIMTIVLGVASAGWHWTQQPGWQSFDLIMMYFMLISLIDYALGSEYTATAFLAGVAMIGIHFLLPSHILILVIGFLLLLALMQHYPPGRIFIIAIWFSFWILSNIPYLHEWEVPFWILDILHGISHICASIGIYKTVKYR